MRHVIFNIVEKCVLRNNLKISFRNGRPGEDGYLGLSKRHNLSIKKPRSVQFARKRCLDPVPLREKDGQNTCAPNNEYDDVEIKFTIKVPTLDPISSSTSITSHNSEQNLTDYSQLNSNLVCKRFCFAYFAVKINKTNSFCTYCVIQCTYKVVLHTYLLIF